MCICDKNNVITRCNYKLFNSFIEANNYYKKNIIILIIIIYQQDIYLEYYKNII
jgi:hypothetical protein